MVDFTQDNQLQLTNKLMSIDLEAMIENQIIGAEAALKEKDLQ